MAKQKRATDDPTTYEAWSLVTSVESDMREIQNTSQIVSAPILRLILRWKMDLEIAGWLLNGQVGPQIRKVFK